MGRQCDIVQDLLPLYVDEICSPASREMISEHISSCENCSAMLRRLKNNEIEEELTAEKTDVIKNHNKLFLRRSALVGLIIGIALMIPVIIVLIVTLATGSSVKPLIIVLAALVFAASLIVVPLVAPRNKFLWTLGLGSLCLVVLLAVCCAFSGGSWFFVAAFGVLFGLSVVFAPVVVNRPVLRERLGNNKGLIAMAAVTILFFLMMISIGFMTKDASFWKYGMRIAGVMTAFVWLLFVIFRYLKANRLIRAGVGCIAIGAFVFAINNILGVLTGMKEAWPAFDPFTWNMFTVDGNVKWIILLCGGAVGLILILIGLIKGGKRR